MALLSAMALAGTAQVLSFGAGKYAAHNWRAGREWSRDISGALRHLLAFMAGEDLDPESGLPHIDHAACCVMFLQDFFRTRPEFDDRYKTVAGIYAPVQDAVDLQYKAAAGLLPGASREVLDRIKAELRQAHFPPTRKPRKAAKKRK